MKHDVGIDVVYIRASTKTELCTHLKEQTNAATCLLLESGMKQHIVAHLNYADVL